MHGPPSGVYLRKEGKHDRCVIFGAVVDKEPHSGNSGCFERQIIPKAREVVQSLVSNSISPFLYLLTDRNGILFDCFGTQETMDKLDEINMRAGTSLSLTDAGINAISLSMLTGERIYLKGEEHDLRLFHDWACLCSPIIVDEEMVGYIDFSFYVEESPCHAMMILARLVEVLQRQHHSQEESTSSLDDAMASYRFSPRELEVARMWLDNRSALYIAATLGIAEGTARNFVKKVYRKMSVQNKGEFIKKLINLPNL